MSGFLTSRLNGFRRLNGVLLVTMTLLVIIGVLFINSACSIREETRLRGLYLQHAEIGLCGLAIYLILSMINYRSLARWSALFYLCNVLLLTVVPLVTHATLGAKRRIFGLQPSETTKLAVILLVAWLLGRRDAFRGTGALFSVLGLMAVPVALVLMQPDLGTALVFIPTVLAMLFAANTAPRAFWSIVGLGALAVIWVFSAVALAETFEPDKTAREQRVHWVTGLRPFQQERLVHFLFPDKARRDGGDWNKRQSEIAVGSGGLWGKGFKKGDQNMLGYLPNNISYDDFIFSVLAEEAGFFGSLVVLVLYAIVIGTVMTVAVSCPDGVGRLLCVGVGTMMFWHVFVNIAMTVGLLPITGLPLPFISSGGTSLLTMMMSLGFVQSVAIHGRQAAPRF